MTFIVGFNCRDGIVLCADQSETDGVTKRYRRKVEGVMEIGAWAVSWAGAGDAHVIDNFSDKLKRTLGSLHTYSRADIESAVEGSLTLVHQEHPAPEQAIQVVMGLWSKGTVTPKIIRPAERLLYRGRSDNACIAREADYCLGGMDVTLAEFILRNTVRGRRITVDEAVRLGVFVTALMKEYADGVGGDTNVIVFREGKAGWEDLTQCEVAAIEAELSIVGIAKQVADYCSVKQSTFQK